MKFAILQFPGSNCDQDAFDALGRVLGHTVRYAWHKESHLDSDEAIIIPGGFSYGDYLRCGAIARFSPIMAAVRQAVARGQIVIGICNGFQILCEAGLLPGALVRNRGLQFRCEYVRLRVETPHSRFTRACHTGQLLRLPIAHGEGCYVADSATLASLRRHNQILFRYADAAGRAAPTANPNGSLDNIAGIRNQAGNVLGLMPHPERACEAILGSSDGVNIFASLSC